jgi:DNA ligase-associated metallophosphoesterase
MNSFTPYTINENNFVLTADRTIYWEKQKTLIIADLHIGKTGHFRKSGIGVPQNIFKEDLQRLFSQLLYFKAEQLIIVGDLSHSKFNEEMNFFKKWRNDFSLLKIILVNGNHDKLDNEWYDDLNISRKNDLHLNKFSFCHDPDELNSSTTIENNYTFCGHLHPGVSIRGKGKQSLHFPCFYFKKDHAVLPAYSRFSGTSKIEKGKGEKVFAIIENEVLSI